MVKKIGWRCFSTVRKQALGLTIKLFFLSFWDLKHLRYLALVVIGGYEEADWPSA